MSDVAPAFAILGIAALVVVAGVALRAAPYWIGRLWGRCFGYRGPYGPVVCQFCREVIGDISPRNDAYGFCPGCRTWKPHTRLPLALPESVDLTGDIGAALARHKEVTIMPHAPDASQDAQDTPITIEVSLRQGGDRYIVQFIALGHPGLVWTVRIVNHEPAWASSVLYVERSVALRATPSLIAAYSLLREYQSGDEPEWTIVRRNPDAPIWMASK